MGGWKERVVIRRGDITEEDVDVVVNAANEALTRGGGVCGAIHLAAGPELERACRDIGGCATGDAVMTDAYDLPCERIIHTVGPIHGGGADDEEAGLLASCYSTSIRLAADAGYSSIAFPGISTGIYGYPVAEACRIALAAVREALDDHPEISEIRLVCFSTADLEEYEQAIAKMD